MVKMYHFTSVCLPACLSSTSLSVYWPVFSLNPFRFSTTPGFLFLFRFFNLFFGSCYSIYFVSTFLLSIFLYPFICLSHLCVNILSLSLSLSMSLCVSLSLSLCLCVCPSLSSRLSLSPSLSLSLYFILYFFSHCFSFQSPPSFPAIFLCLSLPVCLLVCLPVCLSPQTLHILPALHPLSLCMSPSHSPFSTPGAFQQRKHPFQKLPATSNFIEFIPALT